MSTTLSAWGNLYTHVRALSRTEVVLLLVVYIAYGYNEGGAVGYILRGLRDWTNWLFYRGGIGVKGEESWEAWWDEELSHIRTFGGRVMEMILSLHFFIFQYVVIYKLDVQDSNT
ncbi:hypothetical protein L2E82_22231 [Cichorium intybus]|uniref:Uncharacterized protein n=1 Tax=Cichorium intybus TaxID=13427 RepID=A0ACB9DXA3_CICIN|nr:hypothetical protein L2E82_22231 [Cichorium intybus]